MKVCIFEDDKFEQLYPLVYLRPVFELRCGATNLREKISRFFKDREIVFWVREVLFPVFKKSFGKVNDWNSFNDSVLCINGRLLLLGKNAPSLEGKEEIGIKGDTIIYARLNKERFSVKPASNFYEFLESMKTAIPTVEADFPFISYPWELIHHNGKAIEDDFALSGDSAIKGELHHQACIYGDNKKVRIAKGAKVHPFVVLDTVKGPIIIEENAEVLPFSRIEGPAVVGKNSQVLGAARIREGTSIGPVCRVGGEVEESIIHGYSNKYHDGFLGHSYVCEWVNLGALTTNSDLKNDYSTISVYIKGEPMDSRDTKVGSFIGDHTKTSIGTFLNTGTIIGIMCNVVGSGGVAPKFIPSFCWFLNNMYSKGYGFRMQVETAKTAMSRRGVNLSEEDVALLKYVHEITMEEREKMVKKSRME